MLDIESPLSSLLETVEFAMSLIEWLTMILCTCNFVVGLLVVTVLSGMLITQIRDSYRKEVREASTEACASDRHSRSAAIRFSKPRIIATTYRIAQRINRPSGFATVQPQQFSQVQPGDGQHHV